MQRQIPLVDFAYHPLHLRDQFASEFSHFILEQHVGSEIYIKKQPTSKMAGFVICCYPLINGINRP